MKLNIGCGDIHKPESEGWLNLDAYSWLEYANVIEYGIPDELPFSNNSIDHIYCSHVLEHITTVELQFFISECKRVLKKGGLFEIIVPSTFMNYQHSVFMLPYHFYPLYKKVHTGNYSSCYNDYFGEGAFDKVLIENRYFWYNSLSKLLNILRFFLINEQRYVLKKK